MNDKQAQDSIRDAFQHLRKVDRNAVPPISRLIVNAEPRERSSWRLPAVTVGAIALTVIGLVAWLMPVDKPSIPVFSDTYDELLDPLTDMPTDFLLEIPGDRLASATPEFLTTLPDYLIPEDPQDVD